MVNKNIIYAFHIYKHSKWVYHKIKVVLLFYSEIISSALNVPTIVSS